MEADQIEEDIISMEKDLKELLKDRDPDEEDWTEEEVRQCDH